VAARLRGAGLRVTVDARSEKVGFKIREATLEKVPYVLVAGPREEQAGTVAVRKRREGDLGPASLDALVERLRSDEQAVTARRRQPTQDLREFLHGELSRSPRA
jgi:threonyl-tRNA synthetase